MSEQREQQEPKQCECGACGGRGHIERDGEIWMCATCNGTGHVPYEAPRCECRACRRDGMRWVLDVEYSYDYDGHEQRGTTAERVDTCPNTCGCRLSVVDGEPVVGLSVRAVIEQLRLAHDELYEDASLYHEGGDDKGDGAFAWGKQCGYRHAIKMLGGEADGE